MKTNVSGVSSVLTIAFYALAVIAFVLALAMLFGVFNLSATMQSNAFLIRNTVSFVADILMAWLLFVAQFADESMVWALGITGILLVGGGQMMARDARPVGHYDTQSTQDPIGQIDQFESA